MGHSGANQRSRSFQFMPTVVLVLLIGVSLAAQFNCSEKIGRSESSQNVVSKSFNVSSPKFLESFKNIPELKSAPSAIRDLTSTLDSNSTLNSEPRVKRSPFFTRHLFPREPLYAAPSDDYDDVDLPPEEGSINYPRFRNPLSRRRRPQPPPPRRRAPSRYSGPPPSRHLSHPGPPPRPRPPPIPLPLSSDHAKRVPHYPQKPSYSYPKDAANIQDILTYFKKEEQEAVRPRPPPQHSPPDLGQVSMGGDFSKEIHDVQTSLLKDIREFAQRPSMNMRNTQESTQAPTTTLNPPSKRSHKTEKYKERDDDDEDDADESEPKAKPVREMIRNRPNTKETYKSTKQSGFGWNRESSEEKEKRISYKPRYRYEDEDGSDKNLDDDDEDRIRKNHASRERYGTKHSRQPNHSRIKTQNFESTRQRQHIEESEEIEKERHNRQKTRGSQTVTKHHRYASGSYRPGNSDDRSPEEDDADDRYRNHRYGEDPREARIRGTTTTPILLKQPYGHYKSSGDRHNRHGGKRVNQGWDSKEHRSNADGHEPYAPYHAHSHSSPSFQRSGYTRPVTPPPPPDMEDIIEIHTGGGVFRPPPSSATAPPPPPPMFHAHDPDREERERKNRLQKLYLEYLEKKLEAETLAAVSATSVPSAYVPAYPPPPSQQYPPPPPPPLPSYQPLPSTKLAPPPAPMRMKIHIYPNENTNNPPPVAVSSAVSSDRHYSYQAMPPTFSPQPARIQTPPPILQQYGVPIPHRQPHTYGNYIQRFDSFPHGPPPRETYLTQTQVQTQRPPMLSNPVVSSSPGPSVAGNAGKSSGPSTGIDKNKNLVLHLHVHRRQDERDSMAAASEIYTTTVKPLTYKEIYDQVQEQQQQQQFQTMEDRMDYVEAVAEPLNKSLSMEVPIREGGFEDVLHSFFQFGQGH